MTRKLTSAKIRYLSVLYELSRDGTGVRSVDVARELNVSRPSVHSMMEKLRADGYIKKSSYGAAYLTERGKNTAARCAEEICRLTGSEAD
ncbi:MAG: MarR family transcriptional regulator [Solobacterium sp.]|nr:MarR family transcriptional regulator [Solobacterium sp.]